MGFKKLALVSILFVLLNYFDSFAQINMLDTTISIDPRETYLRPNSDPCLDAIPIELSMLSISGGDYLRLQQLGDFNNGPGGDIYKRMIGVFSSNDSLLDSSQLHRIPGAIDAGVDFITYPTYDGNLPTDIPEDFWIDTVIVQVPDSALFLFVSAHDSWYWDNSDPDSDFAVNIKITSPPIKIYERDKGNMLNNYRLYQNYPNPFNPITTIEFSISESEFVTLKIYNLVGQEVSTLVSAKLTAGIYKYEWNASDNPAGVYFYEVALGKFKAVRKMLLVK